MFQIDIMKKTQGIIDNSFKWIMRRVAYSRKILETSFLVHDFILFGFNSFGKYISTWIKKKEKKKDEEEEKETAVYFYPW